MKSIYSIHRNQTSIIIMENAINTDVFSRRAHEMALKQLQWNL